VLILGLAAVVFRFSTITTGQTAILKGKEAPRSLRLYVLDCGTLHIANMARFQLTKEEVATTDLAVPCFLVVHPKGVLIWDTGAVPDAAWEATGLTTVQHITLPDSQQRDVTISKSLKQQLSELGLSPADVNYLALSHYHYDHTANANEFAAATWLVREPERDAMFSVSPPGTTQPSSYSLLRKSKTVLLKQDQYDVFGDGKVNIMFAPGHTPVHQVLYLKLPETGPVVLSGDLYHYPEEMVLDRVPTFEFDAEKTRTTRKRMKQFLKDTGAQMWIQHDYFGNAKLRKSPEYYE